MCRRCFQKLPDSHCMSKQIDKSSIPVGTKPHITCGLSKDHKNICTVAHVLAQIYWLCKYHQKTLLIFRFSFGPVNSNEYLVKLSSHSGTKICEQYPIFFDAWKRIHNSCQASEMKSLTEISNGFKLLTVWQGLSDVWQGSDYAYGWK